MSGILSVAAAAVTAALCAVVVRKQSPEIALALGLGGCALLVLSCSGALREALSLADKLAAAGSLSPQIVEPVIKTAGIAVVTRLASDFCKDAKEGGLSSAVELAGTALSLCAALPLMSAVLDLLGQLL